MDLEKNVVVLQFSVKDFGRREVFLHFGARSEVVHHLIFHHRPNYTQIIQMASHVYRMSYAMRTYDPCWGRIPRTHIYYKHKTSLRSRITLG
ncbi:hypothetical protein SAMN05216323_100121 [Williamwhitmania taraxaci]|uniref:Uncharacterized protein n=1 Tax=Williamwhitmania taraxaci TaxID=1640674 RepID=A0A1G6GGW0_9BACT|nr:hypothetical protein SAMN05216323_100121 [Williamwhitmania taraxaci]